MHNWRLPGGERLLRVGTGLCLLLLVSSSPPGPAEGRTSGRYSSEIEAYTEFVKKQMEADRIPGLSVGFVKGDFLWATGFGFADIEHMIPATEISSYRLASNTKSMTAVALLQLAEQGVLDLDTEVQKYVPYFPRKSWPVTTRLLLGHLAGISHYRDYDVEGHIKEPKDTRDALAIFADFDLVAEPGTEYNYSSYGYNLLGAVIEGAAKQPYGAYLRDHVWGPLEMADTHMDDPDEIIPHRVQGYRIVDGELKNSEYVDISSRFAAGGTHSTVLDLLKYARGLDSGKVLSRGSLDLMQTSMATKDGRFTDYGMGWRVTPVNGRFQAYHTGGQPETRTILVRFPQEDFSIAIAYNMEGANLRVYSRRLAQLILKEAWNIRAYLPNRVDAAVYAGLWDAFNYGLSHYERYGKPHTTDAGELAHAFDYFNSSVSRKALESGFEEAKKKIENGRHPVSQEAFVKVGSYVAKVLAEESGRKGLETYHKTGPIPFFHDFVESYRAKPVRAGAPRLSRELERVLAQWAPPWTSTCNEYVRTLAITPFTNVRSTGAKLKKLFAGACIHPDFSAELARVSRHYCVAGRKEEAFGFAMLSLDLHPKSPISHGTIGLAHVCFGDTAQGLEFMRKALELDGESGAINAGDLNGFAVELARNAKFDEAMAVLEISTGLFPDSAELYDSMANIYVRKGERLYRKALEVDPGYEHSSKMLKRLRQP